MEESWVRKDNLLVYFDSEFLIHLFPQSKDSGVRSGAGTIRKVAVSISDGVIGIFH
jgi:hypothetical protein